MTKVLVGFCFFSGIAFPGVSISIYGAQAPPSRAIVRNCKLDYDESPGKAKHAPKRKGTLPEYPLAPSCVEVQDSQIAVQEFLQSVVREFRWNVGDERASEELWSFTVYLGPDAVATFTKPPADPKIAWSGGKGIVNVRTNALPDGFTRIIVTAKFDGFGEPEDKFAPQRTSWPLPSSGVLETKLTDAARNRNASGH